MASIEEATENDEGYGPGYSSGKFGIKGAAVPVEAENSKSSGNATLRGENRTSDGMWKLRGNPVSDLSTAEDKLGFRLYVDAVAAFLKHPDTKPPLSMSIEGEWGTGKSSFMRQLQGQLDDPKRMTRGYRWRRELGLLRRPERLSFWFNAWRHDKQDAMWATFALSITRELRRQESMWARLRGDVRLGLSRVRTLGGLLRLTGVLVLWAAVLAGAVGAVWYAARLRSEERGALVQRVLVSVGKSESAEQKATVQKTPGFATVLAQESVAHRWIGVLVLLAAYLVLVRRHLGRGLEVKLERYLSQPDYEQRTSFIESFHEDFQKVVRAYAGGRKVFIFVDDLDRCDVPKAAELMQAINLMIGDDEHLVFLLGMDREKVAAGITLKYKDLAPFLKDEARGDAVTARHPSAFGYTYLEKFIQITFRVPRPSESGLREFLQSMGQNEGDRLAAQEQQQTEQAERTVRRRPVEVMARADSEEVQRQVRLVAPALGWNPRRIKQFMNDFRLQAYIASDLGLLDLVRDEQTQRERASIITLEQLGKYVAITMTWPDLVMDLVGFPGLLEMIYRTMREPAVSSSSPGMAKLSLTVQDRVRNAAHDYLGERGRSGMLTERELWLVERWSQEPMLVELLMVNCDEPEGERYNLEKTDLTVLVNIAPRVVRPAGGVVAEPVVTAPAPEPGREVSSYGERSERAASIYRSSISGSDQAVTSDLPASSNSKVQRAPVTVGKSTGTTRSAPPRRAPAKK